MSRDCRVYLDDILDAVGRAMAYTEGYSLEKIWGILKPCAGNRERD